MKIYRCPECEEEIETLYVNIPLTGTERGEIGCSKLEDIVNSSIRHHTDWGDSATDWDGDESVRCPGCDYEFDSTTPEGLLEELIIEDDGEEKAASPTQTQAESTAIKSLKKQLDRNSRCSSGINLDKVSISLY